jgi:hypothetical protein
MANQTRPSRFRMMMKTAFATLARKKQKSAPVAPAPSQTQAAATVIGIEPQPTEQNNVVLNAAPKCQVAHDDRTAMALLSELHQEQHKVKVKQHERQRRDGSRNPRFAPLTLEKRDLMYRLKKRIRRPISLLSICHPR